MRRIATSRRLALLLWAVLRLSPTGHAGIDTWSSIGPLGGYVQAVAIDPDNPVAVYAGAWWLYPGVGNGSAWPGGIYKSVDGGSTWGVLATAFERNSIVLQLAIDPNNTSIVYTGTNSGVYKSANAGVTWQKTGPLGEYGIILSLAIDSNSSTTLYATEESSGGVFKSVDAGQNWNPINTGLPAGYRAQTVALDSLNPSTLYVGGRQREGDSFVGRVYKTTSSGISWSVASTGLTIKALRSLAIDPLNPSTVYAAGDGGAIAKTIDGGAHWSPVNFTALPDIVTSLAIDRRNPDILYAATDSGLYKSTNGGVRWNEMSAGVPPTWFGAVSISEHDSSVVYAGSIVGIYRSLDAGTQWTPTNNGIGAGNRVVMAFAPEDPAALYVGTPGGLYRSGDNGLTWEGLSAGPKARFVQALAVDPQTPSTVYAGYSFNTFNPIGNSFSSEMGILKTTDRGFTWIESNTGLPPSAQPPGAGIVTLVVDPKNSNVLYAGAGGGGVYKSLNGGHSWIKTGPCNCYIRLLAISQQNPTIVYANDVRSLDGGSTWASYRTSLPQTFRNIFAVAVDPRDANTVYVGTDDAGVFKSTNGGITWSSASTGLLNQNVRTLTIDPVQSNIIYAGTYGSGVYRSLTGGAGWSAVTSNGLAIPYVESLAIDLKNRSSLYAGTDGGGAYAITLGPARRRP